MALQPAVLGTARLNNFRLNYLPAALVPIRATRVGIILAGVPVTARVRVGSLRISDILNDAPNTCAFLLFASTPPQPNQKLVVTLNSNDPQTLFSGTLQTIAISYIGRPSQVAYTCAAIDDTALANRRRPFGTWSRISATAVAQELVATYAPDLSPAGIEAGLPPVDVFLDGTEGMSNAFAQLAQLVGGNFKFEDGVAYLFTEWTDDPVDPIDVDHPFLDDPPVTSSADVSQLRTRVYGRGHGEAVPVDVAAGETIIPIDDVVMFDPGGGRAIAGTTPDGAPTQKISYTGLAEGGGGSPVGPSLSPSVALNVALRGGTGVDVGVHHYAYTFVTSVGETVPSPLASIVTTASVPNPTTAPLAADFINHGTFNSFTPIGEAQQFVYTYSTGTTLSDYSQQTLPSPPVAHTTVSNQDPLNPTLSAPVTITVPNSTDPRVGVIFIYVKSAESGGVLYRIVAALTNQPAGGQQATTTAGTTPTSQPAPSANTSAPGQQVAISGVALGPSATTARRIYRTAAGGSQLKLQQTIANNTATTGVQDATPDGSLGANAPTSNTSGLAVTSTLSGFYTEAPVSFATDGAATVATSSAPLFTAGTYVFVTADVGARLYIKSGTNWTPGFYTIVSVSGGAARLDRACATVAAPTFGRWGVDYSVLPKPRLTVTDLVIDATTATKVTSAAFPMGPHCVGNVLVVSNSVGFIEQSAIVVSVASTVATCDKALGSVGSTGGRAVLGGAPPPEYVSAGSPTLITASAGPFSASGGWAQIGDQFIRYTGLSGNALTGIPTSGAGSITITVAYGEHVAVVPALTGVTGLTLPMQRGARVHLWVQRDDVSAQATEAAIDAGNARVLADGVYEGPILVDERRGLVSLTALCDATLAIFARPIQTVRYATRDTKTKSGKPVTVTLTSPPITADLVIQEVQISEIDIAPGLAPKFEVTASSVRFSLDNLLRKLTQALLGV